ncbi:MAG: acyl-CoA dehydrogenase family protein [Pseudomonadota bacterium]
MGTQTPAAHAPGGLEELTARLRLGASRLDRSGQWLEPQLEHFDAIGGWRWGIPSQYGGVDMAPVAMMHGFVAIAAGDMSAALYLTQHAGATELLMSSPNHGLIAEVAPTLAAGRTRLTIGYSQLTTSHQDGPPVMRAERRGDQFVFFGFMPWVTGALQVDAVAAGAVLDSGEQIVVLLPFKTAGVTIEPAMDLLALNSSQTSVVRCDGVAIAADQLIVGPSENVFAIAGLRGLAVSACGIGLLASILARIDADRAKLPAGADLDGLWTQYHALHEGLTQLALIGSPSPDSVLELRVNVNQALLIGAGVMMTVGKGRGFAIGEEAARLYREASFFCVWSASDAVRAATINALQA